MDYLSKKVFCAFYRICLQIIWIFFNLHIQLVLILILILHSFITQSNYAIFVTRYFFCLFIQLRTLFETHFVVFFNSCNVPQKMNQKDILSGYREVEVFGLESKVKYR